MLDWVVEKILYSMAWKSLELGLPPGIAPVIKALATPPIFPAVHVWEVFSTREKHITISLAFAVLKEFEVTDVAVAVAPAVVSRGAEVLKPDTSATEIPWNVWADGAVSVT